MGHARVLNTTEECIITVSILNIYAQRIKLPDENKLIKLLYHQILQTLACCIAHCGIQP